MTKVQSLLAENLKRFRKLLGINQSQLAEASQISPGFLASIETGKKFPSPTTIEALSKALKVLPFQLFFEEDLSAHSPSAYQFALHLQEKIRDVIAVEVYNLQRTQLSNLQEEVAEKKDL